LSIDVLPIPGGVEDPSELGSFTPTFLWLLRDFYFDLEVSSRGPGWL